MTKNSNRHKAWERYRAFISMCSKPKFWERKSPSLTFYDSLATPIYKYVSYETAKIIIETNSIKYSSPTSFNDPFDMSTSFIDFTLDSEDVEFLLEDLNIPIIDKEIINAFYKKNPEQLSAKLFQTLENEKNNTGVSCFSKSYLKTLMWSHYSVKHTGICLGFSFEVSDSKDFYQCPVKYVDKIVKNHYVKDTRQTMYDWNFSKSHIWEYEEEIRRIATNQIGIIPFEKKELYGIYYGLKVTSQEIVEIEELLVKNGYQLKERKRMEINPETFDLIPVDINAL